MLIPYILLLLFLLLTWYVRKSPYFSWDLRLTRQIQTVKNPILRSLLDLTSWVGYPPQGIAFIYISLFSLHLMDLTSQAIIGFISFTAGFIVVQLLQKIIGRPRPSEKLVKVNRPSKSGGFPSSHVAMFVLVFGYFIYLIVNNLPPTIFRHLLVFLLAGSIILVGPSRVYRGKHWASDTLGGYLFGAFCLLLVLN